jgi:hypothetical protein
MDQIRKDLVQFGTFANLPSTVGQKQGNRYRCTDVPAELIYDGAAWQLQTFGVLGSLFTVTDETTASASFVDLATSDSVTFTLAGPTKVVVEYSSNSYSTGAGGGTAFNAVLIDGTQVDDGNQAITFSGTSLPLVSVALWKSSALASGSHTVKIQHKSGGATIHWRDRLLVVTAVP